MNLESPHTWFNVKLIRSCLLSTVSSVMLSARYYFASDNFVQSLFALKQRTQKRMWNGAAQISWAEQKNFAIGESFLSPFEQRPSLSSKRLVTRALKLRHWQKILAMFCHLFAQLCLIWVDFDLSKSVVCTRQIHQPPFVNIYVSRRIWLCVYVQFGS